jgi:plasmid stabilization system protein ParE
VPIIKLLKRAEIELTEACDWYESRQKGLSKNLRKEVKNSLNSIFKSPELYPKRYDTDLRFTVLKKFPYIIVYWYDENLNTIFVTSIFHTKRNPERLPEL